MRGSPLTVSRWPDVLPRTLRRGVLWVGGTCATTSLLGFGAFLELSGQSQGARTWILVALAIGLAWLLAGWLSARLVAPTVLGLRKLTRVCRDLDQGWRYQPDALRPPPGVPRCVAELYVELDGMAERLGSSNEKLRGAVAESERLRSDLQAMVTRHDREIHERTQALQHANEELKRLAREDGLTGIANHRAFVEFAEQVWRIAMREDKPVAVMMIDVDHFKAFNDIYGHQAGDQCLKRIAHCIRDHARRPLDLAARYGGEEFAVILGDTHLDDALGLAEGVRRDVEGMGTPHSGSPDFGVVTVSLGVAALVPPRDTEAATLISMADKALYRAKHNGRNRFDR